MVSSARGSPTRTAMTPITTSTTPSTAARQGRTRPSSAITSALVSPLAHHERHQRDERQDSGDPPRLSRDGSGAREGQVELVRLEQRRDRGDPERAGSPERDPPWAGELVDGERHHRRHDPDPAGEPPRDGHDRERGENAQERSSAIDRRGRGHVGEPLRRRTIRKTHTATAASDTTSATT